jgi:hypothetical protein
MLINHLVLNRKLIIKPARIKGNEVYELNGLIDELRICPTPVQF